MVSSLRRTVGVSNTTAPEQARPVLILGVSLGLFFLLALTGHYRGFYQTDPFTNAAQARAFAEDLDPIMEEHDGLARAPYHRNVAWFQEAKAGTTSQYPPGTPLWAAPFYLVDHSLSDVEHELPSGETFLLAYPNTVAPATIAAVTSVALAALFFGLTLAPYMSSRSVISSMVVGTLGTSAWSVAADKLWQHGPAMMCISAGTYLASRDRFALAGLAFGGAVLVRPHTAVIAACIGLAVAVSRRSVRELAILGAMSGLGLAALLLYNNAVFGGFSIAGGYSDTFTNRLVSDSPFTVVIRFAEAFVHGRVGIVWTSPFVVLALVALVRHRRSSPDWAVGAALGGLVYLFIQFRANRVTGGSGFFSYRYPLEALMAAGPMLAISTYMWLQEGERRKRYFTIAAVLSIVAHGAGAILD